MAGLALIAREQGYDIHGSDQAIYPPISTLLADQHIRVIEGYRPESILPGTDLCVIGNALSRGNALIEHVLGARIPYISGPGWLREHLIPHKRVLAVAGTHGKTTTSSIAAFIMDRCGYQPGFLIGGVPGNFPVSARAGTGEWFVVEADEYDSAFFDKRSKFLHYRPDVLILANLEFDHADIFDSLADIERQFQYLLRSVPPDGTILVNADHPGLAALVQRGCWSTVTYYGSREDQSGWQAKALSVDCRDFEVRKDSQTIASVSWRAIGHHNMLNALAAIAACDAAGVDPIRACACLRDFQLPKRRLERVNPDASIALFDDFAHHPTAIRETLNTLRLASPSGKLIAVIEPRSNTMKRGAQKQDLAQALSGSDIAVVRNRSDLNWDPRTLALHSDQTRLIVEDSVEEIAQTVSTLAQPGDQIVLMSNGSFDGLKDLLLDRLR